MLILWESTKRQLNRNKKGDKQSLVLLETHVKLMLYNTAAGQYTSGLVQSLERENKTNSIYSALCLQFYHHMDNLTILSLPPS